jgi:HK97 family phage major capsid protein
MSEPTSNTSLDRSQANRLVASRNQARSNFLSCRSEPHQTFDALEANLLNARANFSKFLSDNAAPEVLAKISQQQERSNPAFRAMFNETVVPNAVLKRDLTAGTFSAAGALIDPVPTGREWIHELLPFSAAANLATFLELPKTLPFHFPRIQKSATVSWAPAENSPTTALTSTPTFDTVNVSWFQAMSELRFSKTLVALAPVDQGVEAELVSHFNRVKASAIDNVFFAGNGSTQPLGLFSIPTGSGAASSTTISATAPTLTQVANVIALPENLNAFSRGYDAAWVLSPNVKKLWSSTAKFSTVNTGGTLYNADSDTVLGKRALTTTDTTDSNVYYSSRWSDSYVLLSNSTAFVIDPFSLATSDQVRIIMRFLVAIVHKRPECLVIATVS